ncbi:MAG: PEGA domain-containing protein [Brevinematales bacterium]|nr:PEGA domain-containing protein [Brevinematales bacterium]
MKQWIFLGLLITSLSWPWVFILSDPLGADVFVHDTPIGKTPCILTNEPSSFVLALRKPGYRSIRTTVRSTTRVTNLFYTLQSESFRVNFPGYETITIQNQIFRASEVENLALGIYQFDIVSNRISLERINPNKPWFYFSLGIASTGIVAGTVGLILGSIEYEKFTSATSYEEAVKRMQTSMFYDNLALWSYGIAAISGGMSLSFYLEDRAFQKKSSQFIIKKVGYLGEDKVLYDQAMDLLSQKKEEMAAQSFEKLVRTYPDSLFVPPSLYQWGKILLSEGNHVKAQEIWRVLLERYPVLDLYEMTLYELFLIDMKQSQFLSATRYLETMRLLQFFYSVEDIDWFELDLYRSWSQQDPSKLPLYQQKKEAFITTRTYSPERRQALEKEK